MHLAWMSVSKHLYESLDIFCMVFGVLWSGNVLLLGRAVTGTFMAKTSRLELSLKFDGLDTYCDSFAHCSI